VIKPYAAFPLLAERNWRALAAAAAVVVVTAPVLPWAMFVENLPRISQTLAAQTVGDSVFGQPVLMAVVLACVILVGVRRFLWLATPVLWPAAQPIYKVPSMPMLAPLLALCWAIPVPGMTLVGLVVFGAGVFVARRRRLPPWLERGLGSPLLEAAAPVGLAFATASSSPAVPPAGVRRIVGKVS
jgi:hypothetical protein